MADTIVPVQALVLQRIQTGSTKGTDTITHTVWDPVLDPDGAHVIDPDTQKYVETPRLVTETIETEVPEYAYPGDVVDISHFHDLGSYIRLGILQPILPSEDGTVEMYKEAREALKEAKAELEEEREANKADREAIAAERADLEADRDELRALLDQARSSQGQATTKEDNDVSDTDPGTSPEPGTPEDQPEHGGDFSSPNAGDVEAPKVETPQADPKDVGGDFSSPTAEASGVTDDAKADDNDADEVDVEQYHTGGGWYDLPGVEGKVQGADKAREALSNQEGDSTGE